MLDVFSVFFVLPHSGLKTLVLNKGLKPPSYYVARQVKLVVFERWWRLGHSLDRGVERSHLCSVVLRQD